MLERAQVAMLFIDWQRGSRLRFHGSASIDFADPLMPELQGAQFVVRVRASAIFPNCPRYIHRMQQVERSELVPRKWRARCIGARGATGN